MVARLQMLGRFSLHSADGALVPISAARLQSFLAWTALHPGAHDRRRLVSVFWDDLADSQGRNNLRQLLHQLRRAWPAHVDCLETNESVAGWRVPVQVDVTEFEREFARARDASLITCDAHFAGLPGVSLIEKIKP